MILYPAHPHPIQINLLGLAETDSIIPNPGPKDPNQILGSLGHTLTVLKGKFTRCTWAIGPSFSRGKDRRGNFFADKIQIQVVVHHMAAEYSRFALELKRQVRVMMTMMMVVMEGGERVGRANAY